jgi:serine/threonine protein kinase
VKNDPLMKEKPLFEEKFVMKIIYMLLSGLFHVHENDVIHRDIKA